MNFQELRGCFMVATVLLIGLSKSMGDELKKESPTDDYCPKETFQPRCLQNEVVLMTSATYGRMRIGKCITEEEIKGLNEGSRSLGCSTDVLDFFDRKCTGRAECGVRIIEISEETRRPCFPEFLSVYLEATYECIHVADERRSCVVDVTSSPIHIMESATCGTKYQPWILKSPMGQKISISLISIQISNNKTTDAAQPCINNALVVEKAVKRNATICLAAIERNKQIYSSDGNVIDIFLHMPDRKDKEDSKRFIMKLKAVGCSDIVPPEDAYLKRQEDIIMVGCYRSRKFWYLQCKEGKWIGVVGNCSQGEAEIESIIESLPPASGLSSEQVLVITALGGLTLAICLAVVCFGVVCLKRFHTKSKINQDYKTLSCQIHSTRSQTTDRSVQNHIPSNPTGDDVHGFHAQPMPTYSVFVGDGDFIDRNNPSVDNACPSIRM